jgi:hypothetical protein
VQHAVPLRMRAAVAVSLRRASALALVAALATGGRVAHAAPTSAPVGVATSAVPRVFVQELVVDGQLAKPVRNELALRLTEGLVKPGVELVADEATATHVVRATVKVVERDLEIRIELREREGNTLVAHVEDRCDLCGRTEAAETMTSMGLSLHRRVEIALRPAPVLSVTTDPPGALVLVDGEPFGTTPVELPVAAGKHALRITKAGYIAQTRAVDLVGGVRESLTLELQAAPESVATRRPVREAIGWSALGVGIVGTVAGATLIAIHGRPIQNKCHGAAVDADGTCRYVHSTRVPGAIVGAIGVGLLATGIALVVIERRRPAKTSTQARLGFGTAGPIVRF